MGAVDLVVQVESPPSVASALQRVGRAGHQVGEVSRGVLLPKHRADLVHTAVAVERMRRARSRRSESRPTRSMCSPSRWWPRPRSTPGTSTSCSTWSAGLRRSRHSRAARTTRRSTCCAGATRATSSPSCARASSGTGSRAPWPRAQVPSGLRSPVAGPSPTVACSGSSSWARRSSRVGELDEEMVYESRVGDVFALGATSWRIEDITHDRVLVSPAPGLPGRLPFWKGDQLGRPAELGAAIGAFTRELAARPRAARASPDAASTSGRRATWSRCRGAARGDRPAPHDRSSWSSGSATSSATGGWWSTRRTARRCTLRGRWRSAPDCASATAWTPRRCPPTTASCSGSRRPTRTPPVPSWWCSSPTRSRRS